MAESVVITLQNMQLPFGEMIAGTTEIGICLLEFTGTDRQATQLASLQRVYKMPSKFGNHKHLAHLAAELAAYFDGKRQVFSLPLDVRGTEFQCAAWRALRDIPYGETRSYQQQALALGRKNAVRAIANANRNNRISIVIPCHRVIGKDGSMTGYGGGIWRKEFLLTLEGGAAQRSLAF